MASTLSERATLAQADGFRQRVRAQITATAGSIIGFAQGGLGPDTWAKRMALADQVLQNSMSWIDRFAWAVANNSAVSGDMHSPVGVTGTSGGVPAVVTTTTAHGMTTGDIVEITGTRDGAVSGTWQVTVLDSLRFSIPAEGLIFGDDGGTACEQPSDTAVTSAIETVWSPLAGVTAATD